jgi:hypothetical protein
MIRQFGRPVSVARQNQDQQPVLSLVSRWVVQRDRVCSLRQHVGRSTRVLFYFVHRREKAFDFSDFWLRDGAGR